MNEYIERAAAMESILGLTIVDPAVAQYANAVCYHLKNLPAADVAPVRHGQWLLRHVGHGHYWECSVCHKNPCIYVTKNTNYCPNCGAKMDLEAGHEAS